MGLSNSERYSKMLWSVKNIEDKLANLKESYNNEKLKSFSGKLWPALLNQENNSLFWIAGGGFDTSSFEGGGFLFEAMSVHKPEKPSIFDNLSKNYIENNLQLARIIGEWQGTEATVIEVYQWVEHFYYGINRYQDEFSSQWSELKSVVANLKGELFNIISRDPIYLRGYLLFNLLGKCIDKYNDDCPLSQMILNNHLFHHFKLQDEEFQPTEDLMEAWREIQFKYTREIPLNNRILLVLSLLGRRIGDPYNQKCIKKSLNSVIPEKDLKEVFDFCSEKLRIYKEKQNESHERCREHQFCHLTSEY